MISTSRFQITRADNPAEVNSQVISKEVINAEATLQQPLIRNNVFSKVPERFLSKVKAISINESPIPPHPYISS